MVLQVAILELDILRPAFEAFSFSNSDFSVANFFNIHSLEAPLVSTENV